MAIYLWLMFLPTEEKSETKLSPLFVPYSQGVSKADGMTDAIINPRLTNLLFHIDRCEMATVHLTVD